MVILETVTTDNSSMTREYHHVKWFIVSSFLITKKKKIKTRSRFFNLIMDITNFAKDFRNITSYF